MARYLTSYRDPLFLSQLLFGVLIFVAIRTANKLGLGTGRAQAQHFGAENEFAGAGSDFRRSTAMHGPSDYLTAPSVYRAAARRPDLRDTRGSLSF